MRVLLFFLPKALTTSKSLCLDTFKLYKQDCFIMITMHFVGINDRYQRYMLVSETKHLIATF